MRYQVVIWGLGRDYEQARNGLCFEEYKGNLEIVAMVSRDQYANTLDGHPIIDKKQITSYAYDYIVIFAKNYFDEIVKEALNLGIEREKLINGQAFSIPFFDFEKYVALLRGHLSIVSNDCWGGFLSARLGLPMNSPFCNCYVKKEDYYKLLCNLKGYLQNGLELYREGDLGNCLCPVGKLTDGTGEVLVNFNHHCEFDAAKEDWNRRLKRMNYDNIFVKYEITSEDYDYLQRFSSLPYRKVIFTPADYNMEGCRSIPRYQWRCHNRTKEGTDTFPVFIRNMDYFLATVNVLDMLGGGEKFLRET